MFANRTKSVETLFVASVVLAGLVFVVGCNASHTTQADSLASAAANEDEATVESSLPSSTPDLVSLADLPSLILSHQGKLVFVDLWALW